jgi:hypothetical protein
MSEIAHPVAAARRRGPPLTLIAGLLLIVACEVLLLVDLAGRGIMPAAEPLPPPQGPFATLARLVAVLMTPLCWTGFLLAADGALAWHGGSPVRRRSRRFALAYATSVPVWLFFDAVNFGAIRAWTYHGLAESLPLRWTGYVLAFGAISPAMFLVAEGAMRTRLGAIQARPLRVGATAHWIAIAVGIAFLAFPLIVRDPIGALTLWLGLALLLDPINDRLGAPSLLADWRAGWYGRTVALLLGGFVCGLLWEFWNYAAVAKWTYHLPFLGPLERLRYFEMPLPGLLGFPPFAIECWATFQTIAWAWNRVGQLPRVEPLGPDDVL